MVPSRPQPGVSANNTADPVAARSPSDVAQYEIDQSLVEATYNYLLTGSPVELSGSSLTQGPVTLSTPEGKSFQIHSILGDGAEGVVYYGELSGLGWGALAGKDAALKVSHPFSTTDQAMVPGLETNAKEDCLSLLKQVQGQVAPLRYLMDRNANDRKVSPDLYGNFTLPLTGKDGIAVEILATEFIEGIALAELIQGYIDNRVNDNELIAKIRESALTLREIQVRGISYFDSNTSNFVVPNGFHSGPQFAVVVDFGGAISNQGTIGEEAIINNRQETVLTFLSGCLKMQRGPTSQLIERGIQILQALQRGETSLTQACDELAIL